MCRSPVGSLHKGWIIGCFGVVVVVGLSKMLRKQSSCRWLETPLHSCDVTIIVFILLQGIRFTIHSFALVHGCQDVISVRNGGYYYSHSTRQLCQGNIAPVFYSNNTNIVALVFNSTVGGFATGFNITYEAFDPNTPMPVNPEGNITHTGTNVHLSLSPRPEGHCRCLHPSISLSFHPSVWPSLSVTQKIYFLNIFETWLEHSLGENLRQVPWCVSQLTKYVHNWPKSDFDIVFNSWSQFLK